MRNIVMRRKYGRRSISDRMTNTSHENFSRDETAIAGSDRSFGVVIAAAFAVISLISGWNGGRLWPWTGGLAVLFLAAALLYPASLNPLNRLWFRFGLLLHKVVSPIIMGLLFYSTVMPTGLIMRAIHKDLLRLKWNPDEDTYWIVRRPPGPAPETMKDQF